MGSFFLATYSLWLRELVRFVRDRSRLFGAVMQPALLWVLMGGGLGASFRPAGQAPGTTFLEYIYPGAMLLVLLFTAIFSTITVVEDRREGFMQSVLAAPVPRSGVVLGKILGGASLAVGEGVMFGALAPLAGLNVSPVSALTSAGVLLLIALSFTGLGFRIAWRTESTAGFHAVMNLLLLPMWLLSGAFFPMSGAPSWLEWPMRINPVTYGLGALRWSFYLDAPERAGISGLPGPGVCVALTAGFAALMFAWSVRAVERGDRSGG